MLQVAFLFKHNMSEVTIISSRNNQTSLFDNVCDRLQILEEEKYLFLPKNWNDDDVLSLLRYRAVQKGYRIEYAEKSKSSINLVFNEIENAIKESTGFEFNDYSARSKETNLFYLRVIYITIALEYKIEKRTIAKRLKFDYQNIRKSELKHQDLVRFTPEYKVLYNDVIQVIKDNKQLENLNS